jgi:hypothetical protein
MAKGLFYKMMVKLSKWMIACDEASFLISFREDHRLGFRRWWQLKMHLLTCHLCRKYARQIGELNYSLEVYRDQCDHESCGHHLSPEAGSRIRKEITRELNAK